ncbi:MAG: hypothetical protein NC181_05685 [Clostridium sp.]|nr:hypothetical protein [Clostridium sp.]
MNMLLKYLRKNYYRSNENIRIVIGKYYKIYVILFNKNYDFNITLEIIMKNFDVRIINRIKSLKKINKNYKPSKIILTYKK